MDIEIPGVVAEDGVIVAPPLLEATNSNAFVATNAAVGATLEDVISLLELVTVVLGAVNPAPDVVVAGSIGVVPVPEVVAAGPKVLFPALEFVAVGSEVVAPASELVAAGRRGADP
jgi:hypothetical protein